MFSLLTSLRAESNTTVYLVAFSSAVALYFLWGIIYNLFLHPLRNYPGPRLWAISEIPFSLTWVSGKGHKKILDLHLRYGDIVRIAPGHLSFGSPESWNDVMGHRKRGQPENGKDPLFWRGDEKLTLVGSNRERHGRLRKVLSHGFSAQAMIEQQPLFQQYATLLIERLKTASTKGPVEMTAWYNWSTFDMAGDLIFGEPFGCLEKSEYHPWVRLLFQHIRGIALSTAVIRFPFTDLILKLLTPKKLAEEIKTHSAFVEAQVGKRMTFDNPRPDFMESMIQAHGKEQVSHHEIIKNAHNLIVGSSETTATTLAGTTYLLATNKRVLAKLREELRTTFESEDEIDLVSVQKLEYMFAVFDEAMRIYPPVPSAIPRKAPPEGSQVGANFIPPNTILSIWQWPMFHNPNLFKDPELFVPERRLGDPRYDSDRKEALQPFSVGPRNCIGKNLAYAEMRLILARLIWNFDIELDPRSENWLERNVLSFLWDKPELWVRLIPETVKAVEATQPQAA